MNFCQRQISEAGGRLLARKTGASAWDRRADPTQSDLSSKVFRGGGPMPKPGVQTGYELGDSALVANAGSPS